MGNINQRFAGIARLYGATAMRRLATARVAVVGVGGVGSWAAEALARSGVGALRLIDADEVCISNTNRQSHALEGNYGKPKVAVLGARLRAINPDVRLELIERFLTTKQMDLLADCDLVLDACDALAVKVALIAHCRRIKQPVVTVGSAGGRIDAARVQVRDLSRTEHDALLALVRKRLRQQHGFPRNPERYFGIAAVYSMENVRRPPDGSVAGAGVNSSLDCGGGLGAVTHVTGTFGFVAAGKALELLLRLRRE
ncbi:MAG: tRNA threonylcarbamoyladenosine dehydratase [Metallibacterium sp.]